MSEKRKIHPALVVGGAILAIILALVLIFRAATAPKETINDFKTIPPKGAGKFDRN